MPMYDRQTLNKKARELGFNRDAYEKMSRLVDILQYIGGEPELATKEIFRDFLISSR